MRFPHDGDARGVEVHAVFEEEWVKRDVVFVRQRGIDAVEGGIEISAHIGRVTRRLAKV
mgnify:CR=1 FL=1